MNSGGKIKRKKKKRGGRREKKNGLGRETFM
jgi:hypothetical protein